MPLTLEDGTELKLGDSHKSVKKIAGILELPWEVSKEDGRKIIEFIMQFAPKDREHSCHDCECGKERDVEVVK